MSKKDQRLVFQSRFAIHNVGNSTKYRRSLGRYVFELQSNDVTASKSVPTKMECDNATEQQQLRRLKDRRKQTQRGRTQNTHLGAVDVSFLISGEFDINHVGISISFCRVTYWIFSMGGVPATTHLDIPIPNQNGLCLLRRLALPHRVQVFITFAYQPSKR